MKKILLKGTHSRWEGEEKKFVRYNKGDEIDVTPEEAKSATLAGRLGPVPTPGEEGADAAAKQPGRRGRRGRGSEE